MKAIVRFFLILIPFLVCIGLDDLPAAYGLILLVFAIIIYRWVARRTKLFQLRFDKSPWVSHLSGALVAIPSFALIIDFYEHGMVFHMIAVFIILFIFQAVLFSSR